MGYQAFPTVLNSVQDYLDHRRLLFERMNNFFIVSPPTGNAANDTANLQDTITAAITSKRGGRVMLHDGDYAINQIIQINDVEGLVLSGSGRTRLIWSGSSSNPTIRLAHARDCVVSNLRIINTAGAYAGIQLLRNGGAGFTLSPTANRFESVLVEGGTHGFVIGGTGAIDANNDFHQFIGCRVQNYTTAGWYINQSQSYNNVMRDCHASGNGTSTGVLTAAAGGHFRWFGGSMNNNAVDYRIFRHYQPFVIDGVTGENSGRLLHMGSDSYGQVTLQGIRWAGNAINGDLKAILCEGFINNIALVDCEIGDSSDNPPANTTLDFGVHADTQIAIIRSRIASSAVSLWSGKTPQVIEQSWKWNDVSNTWTAL